MDNNKAIVAQVERIEPINGADNIVAATVLGHTVVVSKNTQVGDPGIFFNDGLALSKSFMERNNLINKVDENGVKIPGSGFFSESGRVRAQKFKGVRSEGFFCPLNYITTSDAEFTLGQSFDTWNGELICTKYETPATKTARLSIAKTKDLSFYKKMFPEHKDTSQWRFFKGNTRGRLYFTEKLHGTSARIGNVKVPQKLSWWKKTLNWFGDFYETEKYEIVLGSRRAILPKDKSGNYVGGFYGNGEPYSNLVKDQDLLALLKKHPGLIVYGEIVGYVGNSPLFKQSADKLPEIKKLYGKEIVYSYGLDKGDNRFYVYRMTLNGEDLCWKSIQDLCHEYSLDSVPDDYPGDPYLEGPSLLTDKHPTEGYVIREEIDPVIGPLIVNFYKEKSFTFKVLEGIVKDSADNVDIEEIQQ